MGQKQCTKCGEMVDEAKAFCPGCGNAFVDEKKRTSVSDFDRSNATVQMDNSMFNRMLSDMGLSIAKEPVREKGTIEVAPAAARQPEVRPTSVEPHAQAATGSKYRSWIIGGVIALVLFLALAGLILLVAFVLYFRMTE